MKLSVVEVVVHRRDTEGAEGAQRVDSSLRESLRPLVSAVISIH